MTAVSRWSKIFLLATVVAVGGCSDRTETPSGPTSGAVSDVFVTAERASIPADGDSRVVLTAIALDSDSDPVADGTPVTFAVRSGGGQILGAEASTTDGVAEALYVAGTTAGAVVVTARVGGVTASAPILLTPRDATGLFVAADTTRVLADGADSAVLMVSVTDAFGNPAGAGTVVEFDTSKGVLDMVVPTDSTGMASARLRAVRFQTGLARVTVSSGGSRDVVDVAFVSDEASHIEVVDVSLTSIGVVGSGQPETSSMTFVVRDRNGVPVDLEHAVTLDFAVVAEGTATDATMHPGSVTTNDAGEAIATLNAGVVSGVVQILASSGALAARPIRVVVASDLPDPAHFSLAVERLNVAGLILSGIENEVTVYVGDRHGNPVAEGTAVWFFADGGIIASTGLTGPLGTASVVSLTADPRPGADGLIEVCARTLPAPEYVPAFGDTIEVCGNVMWSGETVVEFLSPPTLDVPNGGAVTISYRVSDPNFNPLTGGTRIAVTASAGETFGATDVTLPDTQRRGPGYTQFEFALVDNDPGIDESRVVAVSIVVTSQNGNASALMLGTIN